MGNRHTSNMYIKNRDSDNFKWHKLVTTHKLFLAVLFVSEPYDKYLTFAHMNSNALQTARELVTFFFSWHFFNGYVQ